MSNLMYDYQISYTNLRRNPEFIEKFKDSLNELLFSRAEDMEPVLQHIYDDHGSIEKYLQSIGVSKGNLKIIKISWCRFYHNFKGYFALTCAK